MSGEGVYGTAGANVVRLLAPGLAVCDASSEQLQERLRSTIRVDNQVAAIRAETLAELRRRQGIELVDTVLREDGLLSRRRARSEIETADDLKDLPETSKGLREGEISYDNARIIAGASRRGNIDEKELADAARTQPPDRFAGTVRKHEQARAEDDGVSRLERQRSRRFARIKTDREDGMTVLYGRFDPVTGARIETVLSKATDDLWREDPQAHSSSGQRMADALERLIARTGDGGELGVKLLLIADYDVVNRKLANARLPDGTPLPASELRRRACDADILPAIFAGESQPLDVGRARRLATGHQRAVLAARDQGCVGCGAPIAWCQAHHITYWRHRGPTDIDNLCLLCSKCHHKVHDNGWKVHRDPDGRYRLLRPLRYGRRPRRSRKRSRRRRSRRNTVEQRE